MRWLFLFVLTLNFLYIGWQLNQSSEEDYADIPALKNVKAIVLLSELKQVDEAAQIADAAQDTAVVENVQPAERDKAEQKKAKPEQLDITPLAVSVVDSSDVIKTKAKKVSPPETVKTPVSSSSASCFTLGPFRDLDSLRRLTREIKSYVVEADFRGREEKEQTLYWVYVKPEKNYKKAVATGKRLKAKKIKDFYVIREGEKIHGLSLGHFRNKNGAYGLAKKVTKLGFNVVVEPVFKTYTMYWLDYQLDAGVSIPEKIFKKHMKTRKKDKINRLSRECAN